jgi:molybdate transport system ATP-binding protein
MSLEIDVELARPGFELAVRFTGASGVTALFGRSGAGKTTVTALLAGHVRPDRGRISLGGRVLVDTAAGLFVPPHRRRIGTVFQDGRLFPHLSVRSNLLYGCWFNRAADRRRLDEIVALLGIEPLLQRYPGRLSGGEKQRVAIGRALLAGPELLVLDEPLAALDAARKAEILPYLERLRDRLKLPMVYVSHSLDEVVRLADTLVLLERGRVQAAGSIGDVMSRLDLGPGTGRTEAGAVIGARVVAIDAGYRLATLEFPGGRLRVPAAGLAAGDTLRLHIRARDVAIALEQPLGLSILNTLPATITEMAEAEGGAVELRLAVGPSLLVARITSLSAETLRLEPGQAVQALIKSVAFAPGLGRGAGPELS